MKNWIVADFSQKNEISTKSLAFGPKWAKYLDCKKALLSVGKNFYLVIATRMKKYWQRAESSRNLNLASLRPYEQAFWKRRLQNLLEELGLEQLKTNKAYSLSGGENIVQNVQQLLQLSIKNAKSTQQNVERMTKVWMKTCLTSFRTRFKRLEGPQGPIFV